MRTDNLAKDYLEVKKSFGEYYKKKLQRSYEELEVARKKYLRQLTDRFTGLLMGALILFPILFSFSVEIGSRICGLYCLAAIILLLSPFSNYKDDTKDKVMNKILAFWGNFKYANGGFNGISDDIIQKSGLFNGYTDVYCDDYFSGIYKGMRITVAEQVLREVHGSGRLSYTITQFDGIFILLNMPKYFSGKTVAHAKGFIQIDFGTIFFGGLSIFILSALLFIFQWNSLGSENLLILLSLVALFLYMGGIPYYLRRYFRRRKAAKAQHIVYLEDIAFGKEWDIEATDQVEARYVLTPVLMERMQDIRKCFHGQKIEFSFFNNKVLIAVHNCGDMFETTSLFTPALSYDKVQKVILQFYSIFAAAELIAGKRKL